MPSIHGLCFDEGQSGRCGIECEAFINGECDIPDEMADYCREELLEKYGNKLLIAVCKAQSKYDTKTRLDHEIKLIMEEVFCYKI